MKISPKKKAPPPPGRLLIPRMEIPCQHGTMSSTMTLIAINHSIRLFDDEVINRTPFKIAAPKAGTNGIGIFRTGKYQLHDRYVNERLMVNFRIRSRYALLSAFRCIFAGSTVPLQFPFKASTREKKGNTRSRVPRKRWFKGIGAACPRKQPVAAWLGASARGSSL